MNKLRRPKDHEFADYYAGYINQVPGDDFLAVLIQKKESTTQFIQQIPSDKWDYAYAPEKWTIKEALLHVIDTERVFTYRALRIARGDKTPLPGFDQNDWVPMSNAATRSPKSILEEFIAVRQSSITLFNTFDQAAFDQIGTASTYPTSPLALGFIIAGHELHHLKILKERYL